MQHMIRWQVEAVKSEITGAVFGFRIVTLRWKRKDEDAKWEKLIPDKVEGEYSLYSGSLDDLYQDEYINLLKINFVSAFREMNRIASDFAGNKLSHLEFGTNSESDIFRIKISNLEFGTNSESDIFRIKISNSKIGLNWIEYTYEEDKDELDRRTCDENRVSDDSEITREC